MVMIKRMLIAVIIAALPTIAVAQSISWIKTAQLVRESMVNIESTDGRCTGFVIDNDRDFVLTAAHCDGKEMYVDLAPAKVRAKDVKNDLMVLYVEGIDRPAMKPAAKNPQIGEQVASYGFGAGWERPMFRLTHVSDNQMMVPDIEGGPWIVLDASFIPGQSGGAIFNMRGEVVSIVQRGTSGLGLGVGVEIIMSKVGRYFTGGK
jgi:S1-C subfamily serine protease